MGILRHLPLAVVLAAALGTPAASQPATPIERLEEAGAPQALVDHLRGLPPRERRVFLRELRDMRPDERRRFVRGWERRGDPEHTERRGDRPGVPEELRRHWESLPEDERRAMRETLRQLPAERRARLRRALQHWDQLTPGQRSEVRRHVERLRRVSKERRERIERNGRLWEGMDSPQRDRMRRRLKAFRALPAEEQEALVEQRFGDRSAEERARILERLRHGEPPG